MILLFLSGAVWLVAAPESPVPVEEVYVGTAVLLTPDPVGDKCGVVRQVTEQRGYIQSNAVDQYGSYPANSHCQYVISAKGDRKVLVYFTKFDMEKSDGCIYDFLRIHDGLFGYSPLVGKYCGDEGPARFLSSGKNLHVEFKSDSEVEGTGFKLVFEFVDAAPSTIRLDCVYRLYETELLFSSDTMYRDYPESLEARTGMDCTFIINVPYNLRQDPTIKILLHFNQSSLVEPHDCHYNRFEEYAGLPDEESMIRTHCTNYWNKDVETSADQLYIHYVSKPSFLNLQGELVRSRFSFWYTIIRIGATCGPGEYQCERGICLNRTQNCDARFKAGKYCNTAFRNLKCFDPSATGQQVVSTTTSLYLFGGIAGLLLAGCGAVFVFWMSLSTKVARYRHADSFNMLRHEIHMPAALYLTHPPPPAHDNASDNGSTGNDGPENSNGGFPNRTTHPAPGDQSPLYQPPPPPSSSVQVTPHGTLVVTGPPVEYLRAVSPLTVQSRRPSNDMPRNMPWVERFHMSDASGSHVSRKDSGNTNRLTLRDPDRRLSIY